MPSSQSLTSSRPHFCLHPNNLCLRYERYFQNLRVFPSYTLVNKCQSWFFSIYNSPSTFFCQSMIRNIDLCCTILASSLPVLHYCFLPCYQNPDSVHVLAAACQKVGTVNPDWPKPIRIFSPVFLASRDG